MDLKRKQAPNYFPECGAIFMANNSTREECFARGLFGLPWPFADFVIQVKTGMLLFLYDYQDRKLYGVFEASCDGALDIVPDAYKSAKLKFPAQVRFKVVWRCAPLPECAFHDVIKGNFYSKFKFNLGLTRNQVCSLLFLFEERKVKVKRFCVSESRHQRDYHMVNSELESHPRLIDISESVLESMPKKLASIVVCDHEVAPDLEDYIPLPSVDPEKIEDYIPLPSADPEEIGDPFADDFQLNANSSALGSFSEVAQSLLQPGIYPSGHKHSFETDDDEPIDKSSRYQFYGLDSNCSKPKDRETDYAIGCKVRGLYSDSIERCNSVFFRLAGLPKVTIEKTRSGLDTRREIMNRLDEKFQMWKNTETKRSPLHDESKSSKNKIAVFSRLGSNSRKTAEIGHREKVPFGEVKGMNNADRNLKRKNSSTVNTCVNAKDGEKFGSLSGKQLQRRRLNGKLSIRSSRETKACNQFSCSLDLSHGGSASSVNNGSSKVLLKNISITGGSDTVISNDADSVTQPVICLGENKNTPVDPSSYEDPVRKLLDQYQEYLSRTFRITDDTEEVSTGVVSNLGIKSCTEGNGEMLLQCHSLSDGVFAEACTQSGTSEAPSKSNVIIKANDLVIMNDTQTLMQPFYCKGENMKTEGSLDVQFKVPDHIHPDTICHEDPVQLLLQEYQEYVSITARIEEDAEEVSAPVDGNVDLKSSSIGNIEGVHEFHYFDGGVYAEA